MKTDPGSINHEFRRFRDHRAELMDPGTHPKDREATIGSGGVLAVGILTGGGFPGAAACVSLMLERCFPDERWPWSEGPL